MDSMYMKCPLFQPLLTRSGLSRFELNLESLPSCKNLQNVVHSYLQISTTKPTAYPMIPDGTQAIFISPQCSIIGGAQTKASEIRILGAGQYFGIRFYPGALRHFFNLNLNEITDQYVDSYYFSCRNFSELHTTIYRSRDFNVRAKICEQWLLKQFKPNLGSPFDYALSKIYQSFGNIRVNQLADAVGWSSRHLNRIFQLHTGLSTKTFTQIVRLQHVCKELYINPDNSINLALNSGYFDQSHLINDFQKHLTLTPSLFFERFKSDFYNS